MGIPRMAGLFRLTHSPRLTYTQKGTAVAELTLAASDSYKDKHGEWQKTNTLFIKTSLFGQEAEIVTNSCTKGSEVYVSGTPFTRKWIDKEGKNHYEIVMHAWKVKPILPADNQPQPPLKDDPWGSQPHADSELFSQPPF